jgi:receptor expression-enhancing protein 5/6
MRLSFGPFFPFSVVFFEFCACCTLHISAYVSHNLPLSPSFLLAQDMTKVQKEYLVLGLGTILVIIIFFGVGAGSLCNLTGFLYPAYKSFQAIETKMKGDDQQWLVYWIMFGFFSVIESFSDFLLYWIPFYYAFKLAFLLWMMLPQTRGARVLYNAFLRDFLKKNESKIDAALADASKTTSSVANSVTDAVNASSEGVKKDN